MTEIIHSGVTAILVSHVMPQVRELCNKILWLDHGKQICFSDDVQRICDAYEEYLNIPDKKKKPPRGQEQIEKLADEYAIRMEKEKQQKEQEEQEKLARAMAALKLESTS